MNRRELMSIAPVALVGPSDQPKQSSFEGWAIVQIMGYQQEAGYVTTEHFGAVAMFRITVPAMSARKEPADTYEKRYPATPERFRLISPIAVHSLHPCDEAEARKWIEHKRESTYAPLFGARADDIPF